MSIGDWIKNVYYRLKYKHVILSTGCKIGGFNTIFEGMNVIGENTRFVGELGYGSYIERNSSINGKIGRFCSIAPYVETISGNHPTKGFVSTHPCFYSTKKQAGFSFVNKDIFEEFSYADDQKHAVVIGNDVWIGYGVKIISGVTIGDGVIIAAGSVVTKDIAPYSIVGGNPAKFIRYRFTSEQIYVLLDDKWWNKDMDWLRDNYDTFSDIQEYVKFIGKDVKHCE